MSAQGQSESKPGPSSHGSTCDERIPVSSAVQAGFRRAAEVLSCRAGRPRDGEKPVVVMLEKTEQQLKGGDDVIIEGASERTIRYSVQGQRRRAKANGNTEDCLVAEDNPGRVCPAPECQGKRTNKNRQKPRPQRERGGGGGEFRLHRR